MNESAEFFPVLNAALSEFTLDDFFSDISSQDDVSSLNE
jgi:hypothetical protein